MPYPNEHAARLLDPDTVTVTGSSDGGKLYNRIDVPESVRMIWGRLKRDPEAVVCQALRFPTKNWTEAEARKWLKDNDVKPILFEPATGEEKTMESKIERRFVPSCEVRLVGEPDGARTIAGYAAVFNQRTEIGGWFTEEIAPGAFTETITADDVRCLFNHDANIVLGRNKAGTLRLTEDERGLAFEVDAPDTQAGRDLLISIKRGDVSGASFGFEVLAEEFRAKEGTDGKDLRIINRARLWDVGPVVFPAYEQTEVGVRSHEAWLKSQEPPVVEPTPDPLIAEKARQYRAELES